jgi:transposase
MPKSTVAPQIISPKDLPKPTIERRSRDYRRRTCPRCQQGCYRNTRGKRRLHDLGNPLTQRPHSIEVIYSQHRCERCKIYFNADTSDLAPAGSHYTHRVLSMALRLVVEDGLPYRAASWHLWRDHRVFVPFATIQNWVEGSGKKK